TITKAITIDATGANATVNSANPSSIVVNAPANHDVILRGLAITGTPGGTVACPFAPQGGITVLGGRTDHIAGSLTSGISTAGINVSPTAASTRVVVSSSTVSNVCGIGINAAPLTGQTTPVLIRDTNLVDNGTGVAATNGGQVFLVDNTFTSNDVPTSAAGGSITVESSVKTPDPVVITEPITPAAQKPVACKALPKKLKAGRTTVILNHTCVTTGGKKVSVKVTGKGKKIA